MLKLIIGNRNYSSWSMRAWLALNASSVNFDVERVALFADDWKQRILEYSPAGRVPVLIDGDSHVWDSFAIMNHLLEYYAGAPGWPADPVMRAHARSISNEMHSGFIAVRNELPQNLKARTTLDPDALSETCRDQIARIDAIWSQCYQQHGGPWLFGEFGIADIMYIPVALRFVSYGIAVSDDARRFIDATCDDTAVQAWIAAAKDEKEALAFIDELIPESDNPLTLG